MTSALDEQNAGEYTLVECRRQRAEDRRDPNDAAMRRALLDVYLRAPESSLDADLRAASHYLATTRDEHGQLLAWKPIPQIHKFIFAAASPLAHAIDSIEHVLVSIDIDRHGSLNGVDFNERIENAYFNVPLRWFGHHASETFAGYIAALELSRPFHTAEQHVCRWLRLLSVCASYYEGNVDADAADLARSLAMIQVRVALERTNVIVRESVTNYLFAHPLDWCAHHSQLSLNKETCHRPEMGSHVLINGGLAASEETP